ncbi:outer membrane protein OmpA-like peptidoglycan-associated protein [Paraburkholderia eburnea]|uniref:Outer membrane protein OmpA-like peptidoglycan-associated protein n=1 Tax=Paraburkholderia eburnea TaxID=1189126 RepID=A0A2S4M4S9_9BURK|nr:OmpA family protein [Paraburkholderia eburnea]POR49713.1 outer membrane protein OmpA-like peptidoglycan-associated protein [Paraburkholderia eburnea]PRZ20141.1 outer membrane protein OmpA-like peptidoglycan-associated protein [Paraburkholderia eburnea]
MKMRLLPVSVLAFLIVVAAGCTTASGPMHNLDVVTLANGTQAYRVQCLGLLESSKECMKKVNEICGDKQPLRVSSVDRAASGFKPENDPREILFVCQAPQPAVQEAPPPPPPPPVVIQKAPRSITLNADANFAINKYDLLPAGKQALDKFIADSDGVNIGTVTVDGHTDSTGSKALNDRLSQRRAQTVRNYLQSHGLHATQYEVHGYGASKPIASNATVEGRAQNRRVEIQTDGVTAR